MTDRIDILINARNQTSGAFNAVKQEMSGLDNIAGQLNRGLSGIGAIAGVGAVVAGLQQIGSTFDEIARRGAVFEQLGSVLNDFAASVGSSSTAFVEAGRRAAQGTIADYELILNANRAIQFEVAQTAEQYAQLIELSTALGRAQGISDTQALEFITTGIARESRLILDNLGLIIDLDEATSKYAATLGKQGDELTQAERKQAILAEAYRQGATAIEANRDAADSTATKFERFDATVQNLNDNWGKLAATILNQPLTIAESAVDSLNTALAGGPTIDQIRTQMEEVAKERDRILRGGASEALTLFGGNVKLGEAVDIARLNKEIEALSAKLLIAGAASTTAEDAFMKMEGAASNTGVTLQIVGAKAAAAAATQAAAMAEAEAAQRRHETQSGRTGAALTDLYAALENASPATRRLAHEMLESGYSVDEVTERVRILRGELNLLQSAGSGARSAIVRAAAGVAGIIGDAAALNLAKQKTGELNFALSALNQQVQDGTISSTELAYETARLNDEFTGTFDAIHEADRAAKQFAEEGMAQAESAAKKAANEIEQAFERLKGTVSGVLQAALDPGVGVDVNSLLKDGVKLGEGQQPKPEDFLLPRADDINEAARRLADVAVNGWKSPWVEYLQNTFPDLFAGAFAPGEDIRKNAALALRDFEDGLQPQLLDKDKAKERVKRILLGEANMAQLAQEIASELSAEFGGSISLGKIQATASAALGVDEGNADQLAKTLTGAASVATEQLSGAGSTFRTDVATAVGEIQAAISGADTQLAATLTGAATGITEQLTSVGKTFRDGIVSALDGIGEVVATTVDKQFRAEGNLKIVTEAGRANGEAWSSGFLTAMDSLSSQVLEKLATLVGPYVEAIQARNQTLNGAN